MECTNPELTMDNIQLIECRDAVLAWDSTEKIQDVSGGTRDTYIHPRQAAPWPKADFIVGNPPVIGNSKM